MGVFRLSRRAEADLADIARYTMHVWGADQTIRYLDSLMEHARHVLFYRRDASGVLISRILHERMLPEQHDLEEA